MGLMDKVKAQAATATATATAAAKDAAQKGQAKLDEIQAKRAADQMLRDLGAAYYAQESGRGTTTTSANLTRLVGALKDHEAANGPIELAGTVQTAAQGSPGPISDTP
jgi:hypothetical protein